MPNKLEGKDWKFLLSRIKEKECTPFLGAGACCEKIPIGSQIASDWAKKYGYPMEDSYDLIRMAHLDFLATVSRDQNLLLPRIQERLTTTTLLVYRQDCREFAEELRTRWEQVEKEVFNHDT